MKYVVKYTKQVLKMAKRKGWIERTQCKTSFVLTKIQKNLISPEVIKLHGLTDEILADVQV